MKIALCAPGEVFGGLERFVFSLAVYLHRVEAEKPFVLLLYDGLLRKKLEEAGVDVQVVPGRSKFDISALSRIVKLFKKKSVDVVHTQGYKANILCGLAAKRLGLPLVKTEHGNSVLFSEKTKKFNMAVHMWADRFVSKRFMDRVVYVSKQMMAEKNGVPPSKRSLIYNGLPQVDFQNVKASSDLSKGIFRLGIIGRLEDVKGHAILWKSVV